MIEAAEGIKNVPQLDDQLAGMVPGGAYRGRAEAPTAPTPWVWAPTALPLNPPPMPRVRRL